MGLHCGDAVIGMAGTRSEAAHVFGDCASVAERLLHRARAGEYVLSESMMERLRLTDFLQEPESLPPLEIPRRAPIQVWGVLLDTRLDFT